MSANTNISEISQPRETSLLDTVRGNWQRLWGDKRFRLPFSIIATLLILSVGVGTVLYYIIGPAEGFLTSDTVDSIAWANAYFETGELITDQYYYAAILPFGGNQIFYPFLAIFGYGMPAQIGGLVLFTLLLAAALYYMASGVGLSCFGSAGLTTVFMLIMSSSAKLREIMWEHIFYYNLGILFFCFGFGLAVRLIRDGNARSKRPIQIIRLAVLLVFCGLAALDGLQALVCLTVPLVGALALERLLDKDTKLLSMKNLYSLGFIAAIGVASMIGFLMIEKVTGGVNASYADSYSNFSDLSGCVDRFLKFFPNWLTLIGVDVAKGDPLVSIDSLFDILRIVLALLLLITPVVLLCFYKRIQSRGLRLVLLGHFIVSFFILFAVTFGNLGGANWRLTPMLGTSVIVSVMAVAEMLRHIEIDKRVPARLSGIVLAVLIMSSGLTAYQVLKIPADHGRQNSWHKVAAELEARDLKYGYGQFWWANAVTLISDGAVEMSSADSNAATGLVKSLYQMPTDAYDDKDTDRYFVMFNEKDNEKMASWIQRQTENGVVIDSFTVESEPYDLSRYGIYGSVIYIYVFNENPF
ncbi:MAG: hypothetical protein IJY08_05350 [Clostridia bacterium]|nr:hypothetical protein [Clostridia bacterium]